MRVLVACEESQEVCKAFRARGHEAYSLDLLPCSGGHPEWHIQDDVFCYLNRFEDRYWDLIIIHIPCTKVAVSGNRWYGLGTARHNERRDAIEWSDDLWELVKKKARKAAFENPVSVLFKELRFDDVFYIQPWQFGHGETKKTGFATYGGLPRLRPTNIVEGREQRIWKMGPTKDPLERAKQRSKTFPGIADAIGEQWGGWVKIISYETALNKVARSKGYMSFDEMRDWYIDHNFPQNAVMLVEVTMKEAAEIYYRSKTTL